MQDGEYLLSLDSCGPSLRVVPPTLRYLVDSSHEQGLRSGRRPVEIGRFFVEKGVDPTSDMTTIVGGVTSALATFATALFFRRRRCWSQHPKGTKTSGSPPATDHKHPTPAAAAITSTPTASSSPSSSLRETTAAEPQPPVPSLRPDGDGERHRSPPTLPASTGGGVAEKSAAPDTKSVGDTSPTPRTPDAAAPDTMDSSSSTSQAEDGARPRRRSSRRIQYSALDLPGKNLIPGHEGRGEGSATTSLLLLLVLLLLLQEMEGISWMAEVRGGWFW